MLFNNRLTIQDTCKLTDTTYPVKSYLTSYSFPAQDNIKLGTEKTFYIRSNKNLINETDKTFVVDEISCYIIRYDTEYPFKGIAICNDDSCYNGSIVIFTSIPSNEDATRNEFIPTVLYPEQQYKYYNNYVKVVYSDFSNLENATTGIIVRADDGEPAHAVIAEITSDSHLRFITSEEAICLIDDFKEEDAIVKHEQDMYELMTELLGEYNLYGSE